VIRVDDAAGVRLVTFDRPEARNAFNLSLYQAVTAAMAEAAADPAVHVLVLTGAGTAFCAGQDLKEMAAIAAGTGPPGVEKGFRGLLDVVGAFPKPLLAAVNGVGVGLGFTLLAHCDLVFISDDARLRAPFAELGVPPEAASSYLFPAVLGWQRAAQVLFSGPWVSAAEAVEWGIALRRCPPDELLEVTMDVARQIAGAPLDALVESKRLLLASRDEAVAAARRREDEAFTRLLGRAANQAALERFSAPEAG